MLNQKMLAVMGEVNGEVAEREELVEAIAIALLTRKNLFILGDTGQAKSYAINLFRSRITGARQFERLLSKQCDEEQLFGRLDLSSLIPGSAPQAVLDADPVYAALKDKLDALVSSLPSMPDTGDTLAQLQAATDALETCRKALAALHSSQPAILTAGKIPESHICFVDEVFKANDGVLNSLLTALNERKYTNEGRTIPIPTVSFFGASNEIPNFNDPEEQILRPLFDRFELKVLTQYVESRDARLAVLKNKQSGASGQINATVSLDELCAMQREVAAVTVPEAINELMDDVVCELRSKGIHISDRKLFGYYPIAQAKAWLAGRDTVEAADLMILRLYLWTHPEGLTVIDPVLTRMCIDPLKNKLDELVSMAAESYTDFEDASDKDGNLRIGKLRNEFLALYDTLRELTSKAQSDSEREQIEGALARLEEYSKKAHSAVGFSYIPLPEIYQIKQTA